MLRLCEQMLGLDKPAKTTRSAFLIQLRILAHLLAGLSPDDPKNVRWRCLQQPAKSNEAYPLEAYLQPLLRLFVAALGLEVPRFT